MRLMAQKKTKKSTRRQPSPPTVERRIFFYRIHWGTDDSGQAVTVDVGPLLRHIKHLPWTLTGRYMRSTDAGLICCWVDSDEPRQRIRLAKVRRAGLPQVEDGSGTLTALSIPASAGLAEITHMMFFPRNIVGAVFNFYGPRATTLAAYLRARVPDPPPHLEIEPLIRADIVEQLDRFQTLRLVDLKIRPSYTETVQQANDSLGSAFAAALAAVTDELKEIELVLRSGRKKASDLGETIKKAVRWLARREDMHENSSRFVVAGLDQETQSTATLDLLSDKLVTKKTIIRQGERTRALVDTSAYEAISQAYNELRGALEIAAIATMSIDTTPLQHVITHEKRHS